MFFFISGRKKSTHGRFGERIKDFFYDFTYTSAIRPTHRPENSVMRDVDLSTCVYLIYVMAEIKFSRYIPI